MQEQLISFEIAALAEKVGLVYKDLDTHEAYDVDGNLGSIFYSDRHYKILAPTQSLLQRWLREKKTFHVEVIWNEYYKWYQCAIYDLKKNDCLGDTFGEKSKSYEEALEEGLKQALLIAKNI